MKKLTGLTGDGDNVTESAEAGQQMMTLSPSPVS